MRPVRIPDAVPTAGSPAVRSFAACLAAIVEVDVADVPVPTDGGEPWTPWRGWLATRGLGLVPVAEPAAFSWPGPWIAVLASGEAALAFGAPPGIVWRPLGGDEPFEAVVAGHLVVAHDIALWAPPPRAEPAIGRVELVAVAAEKEAPMRSVERAVAHAGRGLEGDRYYEQRGTFTNSNARGHDLTLIEAEVLEELSIPWGRLSPQEARRNVVTRGIDLTALVGRRFRIGDVECFGQRLCEPCAHLERLTAAAGKPGTLRALIHKGGLRADVLTDGEIHVGDTITIVE
jgi:MOSC domain-containing protein YiiM